MPGFIDVNGRVSSSEEAILSPFDRGFLLGDGCFEVLKVEKGGFIFLEDHLDRLFSSLEDLGFCLDFTKEKLVERMQNLLKISAYKKAYFRVTVTGGSSLGFSVERESLRPNVYLFIKELEENEKKPLSIKLVRSSFTDRSKRIKSNNYSSSLRALALARKEGYDDILWVNSEGEITEGSTSNVFFVKEKKVVTPSLSSGLLAGVTRKNTLAHLKKHFFLVSEEIILEEHLKDFDICFFTSSIKGLTPVSRVSDFSFSKSSSFVLARSF